MNRIILVTLLIIETVSSKNINREKPIYKVLLKQRGNPQYLRYDLKTASLREFTICTWLRFVDLEDDQTIFSYVSTANKVILSIWVEAGGANMRMYLDGITSSNIPVSFNITDWTLICLSYQSDYGAWAVYVDTQLVACEESHMLSERYLPGYGSVLIGRSEINGTSAGIQAEIFGVNMILISTIERKLIPVNNYRRRPEHLELQNIKDTETKNNYVILSQEPGIANMTGEDVVYSTSYQVLDQPNKYSITGLNNTNDYNEQEILDFPVDIQPPPAMSKNFWDIVNKAGHEGKFKKESTVQLKTFDDNLPLISSVEVPPPPAKPNDRFFLTSKVLQNNKMSPIQSDNLITSNKNNLDVFTIPDIETPPPLDKNPKVYGHWTGSSFAGKVLGYLKSINFKESRKNHVSRVPPTIPLTKTSDLLPYPTDFRATFVIKPKNFERRNDLTARSNKVKRHSSSRQINVQIISENRENLREKILKFHALTKPVQVEVTNRGEIRSDNEYYKHIDNDDSASYHSNINKVKAVQDEVTGKASRNMSSTLAVNSEPAKEDKEYADNGKDDSDFDIYMKRILAGNKISANNFDFSYVPQVKINNEKISHFKDHVSDTYRIFHTVSRNHNYNITPNDDEPTGLTGRPNIFTKFENKMDLIPTTNNNIISNMRKTTATHQNSIIFDKEDNFHKPVKIGNTLNERRVIGVSAEEKQRSFVGGDEQIPDIHRYRSDIDDEISKDIPPSLGARMCLTIDKHIGALFAKLDGSIGTKLTGDSMSQTKNVAIEFISIVYRQCSVRGFVLERDPALVINWLVTPVQLLGGAYPQRLHSVCSFKYK